jgi:hypothetical protein
MSYFKDELMRERENVEREKFVECSRVKLYQTTKHFYKELEETNTEGLVVKLAAFDSLINSISLLMLEDIQLVADRKKRTRNISSPHFQQNNEPVGEL